MEFFPFRIFAVHLIAQGAWSPRHAMVGKDDAFFPGGRTRGNGLPQCGTFQYAAGFDHVCKVFRVNRRHVKATPVATVNEPV